MATYITALPIMHLSSLSQPAAIHPHYFLSYILVTILRSFLHTGIVFGYVVVSTLHAIKMIFYPRDQIGIVGRGHLIHANRTEKAVELPDMQWIKIPTNSSQVHLLGMSKDPYSEPMLMQ